jgi:hypothetical protein
MGTIVRFLSDVERWQVQLQENKDMVRVRESNLRRDRIEITPDDAPVHCVFYPAWSNREDAEQSANQALVQYVLARQTQTFAGRILVYAQNRVPYEYKAPKVILLRPSSQLWDVSQLSNAIRAALPHADVQLAHLAYDASLPEFLNSATRMILQAHRDQVIYVAIRTTTNTQNFGVLQTMVGENTAVTQTLLGCGSVVCEPTGAIVFHKDNMIKLSTTMTLSQATRKVADMVTNGIEALCPICMEAPLASDPTVFMPCECKVAIHHSCLLRLFDNKSTSCPVCRTPLGRID